MAGLLSKRRFLRSIRSMDPYEFEHFVAEVWDKRGYDTTVRSGSGDRGIDVVATRGGEKHLIQVKRYSASNKIGSKIVREYATLYQQVEDADSVVIVTASSFTPQASKLARDLNVEAVDADALFKIVNELAPDVAVRYLHQEPAHSSEGDAGGGETTKATIGSPFQDEEAFFEIKSDIDFVGRCPNCGSSEVWQGKIRRGTTFTLIKCEDCETVWSINQSWPDKPLTHDDWDQIAHVGELEKREQNNDPCFIATAAYGTSTAREIDQLRDFRDEVLLSNQIGSWFVEVYYTYSPPVADWVSRGEWRRKATRMVVIKPSLWVTNFFTSGSTDT